MVRPRKKRTRHTRICREFDLSPLARCAKGALGALPARDRALFIDEQHIACSVFFDECVGQFAPESARWDYLVVSTLSRRKVVAVEVHEGTVHAIDQMLAKKAWTQRYLQEHCPAALPKSWLWVAPEGVRFPRGGTHAKRLATAGIRFPTRKVVAGDS